ncbi:gag-pol polyprotein, partial [Tanacetum coccineum]
MEKMHDGIVCTIRDVRHVKSLKKNLLSLRQLDDLGCKVEIQNMIMKIIKGAFVLMRGEKVAANLYQLKGEIIEEGKTSVASQSPSHRVAITWHHKLGHMSKQGMKILMERKLLPGLTKNWFTLMCGKNQFNPWEEQRDVRQEEIKRQFITAYTPQQNEVAEWMDRTLLVRARAMLATASLGKSFWAKVVNTACYVINRSPSTAVELKTPMEMWTGKPINYLDLHIFGSHV